MTKLTDVLDKMAPVRTIQTRTRYAPWVGERTKDLQREIDEAQEKAAISDNPDPQLAAAALSDADSPIHNRVSLNFHKYVSEFVSVHVAVSIPQEPQQKFREF